MKRTAFCFLLVLALGLSVCAQKKREIGTPVTVNYCLPKVSFLVKVKMEYTQSIPGPYRQYALQELGMKPEITSLGERWRIQEIEVKPFSVPDENAMYAMTASGDYQPVMLSLSPEGFLAGVAAGPLDASETTPVMNYRAVVPNQETEVDITSLNTYNPLKEVLDTNYTFQEVDGVMKKIWDPIVRYTAKSNEDNKNEAVKEIFRIRSERVRLVAAENEVPDGTSLALILKELDKMEQDYLSLFMGKKVIQTVEHTFFCTPEKAGEATVIFRFSETEGIVGRKNVSATPYILKVEDVRVPALEETAAVATQGVIYYRVPAVGEVKLMRTNEELQRFQTIVPQLGTIKTFPTDVISNEGLVLEFYPEYGSLRSVNKRN